ncbi:MAG: glutaredoxin [Tissierellia bacterium]|nr:glutaredoxin [Tissierellia bacterium]
MFTEEIKQQLKEVLSAMQNHVKIRFFTDNKCPSCADAEEFIETMSSLSDHLSFEKVETEELVPAYELTSEKYPDASIRFNGIPGGHEINSFLQAIVELSGLAGELPEELIERVSKIDKDVDIKVFVTLGCPHCPGAVAKANRLAMENPHIKAQMIEAQTFYELSEKYNVSSVPKIVINESFEFVGNQPIEKFIEGLEQ